MVLGTFVIIRNDFGILADRRPLELRIMLISGHKWNEPESQGNAFYSGRQR